MGMRTLDTPRNGRTLILINGLYDIKIKIKLRYLMPMKFQRYLIKDCLKKANYTK